MKELAGFERPLLAGEVIALNIRIDGLGKCLGGLEEILIERERTGRR